MKYLINLLIILGPLAVLASGGERHEEGVPKVVVYQVINVSILVFALIYFTKDAIVAFFTDRSANYLKAAQKSAIARENAERELEEIKAKLAHLEATREESIKKAHSHADDMKKQIMDEANDVSKRIKEDAELTVNLEVQRASKELRAQLVAASMEAARQVLTKDLGGSDQQKLQKDFVNNIGV